jgi:hypothetical protein
MAPNGVFIRYPPANGCPPGRVWHAPQCPAAERASPLATSSAEKLDGLGGSIGAIEGRHAKRNKPANMKQAVTSIRSRCGESSLSFSNRSRSSYWNSISIHSPIRLSPQLTNCLPDRIRRISILNLTIDSRASGICVVVGPNAVTQRNRVARGFSTTTTPAPYVPKKEETWDWRTSARSGRE